MKYRVTAALTAALAAGAGAAGAGWAQSPPTQTSKQEQPVQSTQAPENQAIRPGEQKVTGPLTPAMGSAPAASTRGTPDKWDVNAPPGMQTRQIRIDTAEGSWMNVDVSPDGRTIAFDLLGDIYTMPIGGGHPTRITSGLAFDMQPRFSPDGRLIAFTSDRGGGDNIWVMNLDGGGARQITRETFRLLNAPTWSRDGQYIAARKHFTTTRSLGTGEIWLYHVSGVGDGVPLVERPNP